MTAGVITSILFCPFLKHLQQFSRQVMGVAIQYDETELHPLNPETNIGVEPQANGSVPNANGSVPNGRRTPTAPPQVR